MWLSVLKTWDHSSVFLTELADDVVPGYQLSVSAGYFSCFMCMWLDIKLSISISLTPTIVFWSKFEASLYLLKAAMLHVRPTEFNCCSKKLHYPGVGIVKH